MTNQEPQNYDKIPQEFREAKRYVMSNRKELLDQYGDKFIAVLGSEGVIDCDEDYLELLRRVRRKTHTRSLVLFSTIEKIINPDEILMASPQIED